MPIHEKHLIEPERLLENDNLIVDGVDVSGHWNTMIQPRTIKDYDPELEKTIEAIPGGERLHRCWQCGSCTNACTMNALNPDFNPRYWIYLIRLGLMSEIEKNKEIIWQCVSCNKCTHICPKDVRPEAVMKALSHHMEHVGITPTTQSTIFDEEFTEQILQRGRIEDGQVLVKYMQKTGQSLNQGWLVKLVKATMRHLPVGHLVHMGLHFLMPPKTRQWKKTGAVLQRYLDKQKGAESHG